MTWPGILCLCAQVQLVEKVMVLRIVDARRRHSWNRTSFIMIVDVFECCHRRVGGNHHDKEIRIIRTQAVHDGIVLSIKRDITYRSGAFISTRDRMKDL